LILFLETASKPAPPSIGAYFQAGSALALETQTAPSFAPQPGPVPLYKVRILKEYPHDPEAFTQGLIFSKGFLYESTGLNGRSSLRQVELETGRVVRKYDLPCRYFAEGLALWNRSLIQLTWRSGKGFVYNLRSFSVEREFNYSGEGWGLTQDGKALIMSNGTAELIFLDPETLARKCSLTVTDRGRPVRFLNELEYIKGEIFANVWQEDFIARISPETGQVTGWIDASDLRRQLPSGSCPDVLNGIAYDGEKDRIFVTGKLWPLLFEIELIKCDISG
jgi:glutamine cyclotransferase